MKSFEYLLLFTIIILGLAVTDLAVSVQRLLAAGKRVRWDWLAPLAALVAFLTIITQWWGGFGLEKITDTVTFEMFAAVLTSAILMFLICATALPDDFGERPIDLRDYYASVSRRYWLLFLAHWALAASAVICLRVVVSKGQLTLDHPVWLTMPLALSFLFIKSRWWHALGMIGLVALYLGLYVGHTLPH